jgi:hypothetical protein
MRRAPLTITIDPDSELGRALDEANGDPIVLVRDGVRFHVTRDPDDPWASHDPEKVRDGLKKVAALLTPEEGTRPNDRP